jgi:hypothetical protein
VNRRSFLKTSGTALLGAVLTSPRCPPKITVEYYYAGLPFYGLGDRIRVLKELQDIYFRAMRRALRNGQVPYKPVSLFYVPVKEHEDGMYGTIGFNIQMGPLNKYAPEVDIFKTWKAGVKVLLESWGLPPEKDLARSQK